MSIKQSWQYFYIVNYRLNWPRIVFEISVISKYEQNENVLSLRISLFIQYWKWRESASLVCLGIKKKPMKIFLLHYTVEAKLQYISMYYQIYVDSFHRLKCISNILNYIFHCMFDKCLLTRKCICVPVLQRPRWYPQILSGPEGAPCWGPI